MKRMRGKAGSALYFSKLRKLYDVLASEDCLSSQDFAAVAENLVCGTSPVSQEVRESIKSRANEACTAPTVELQQFYVFVTSLLRDWTRRIMLPDQRVLGTDQLTALLTVQPCTHSPGSHVARSGFRSPRRKCQRAFGRRAAGSQVPVGRA